LAFPVYSIFSSCAWVVLREADTVAVLNAQVEPKVKTALH